MSIEIKQFGGPGKEPTGDLAGPQALLIRSSKTMEPYINGEFSKAFVAGKLVDTTYLVVELIQRESRSECSWSLGLAIMKLIAEELDLRAEYVVEYIERGEREGHRLV
jgi:hypothetical protein